MAADAPPPAKELYSALQAAGETEEDDSESDVEEAERLQRARPKKRFLRDQHRRECAATVAAVVCLGLVGIMVLREVASSPPPSTPPSPPPSPLPPPSEDWYAPPSDPISAQWPYESYQVQPADAWVAANDMEDKKEFPPLQAYGEEDELSLEEHATPSYFAYSDVAPPFDDEAEMEGEEDAQDEDSHPAPMADTGEDWSLLLPLPACHCLGSRRSDQYKAGASHSSETLCMNPWGDPAGKQDCFPALAHGECPKVMRKCNNTEAAKSEAREKAKAKDDSSPCLCAFDIDRTLTAKQFNKWGHRQCHNASAMPHHTDSAFGGGEFTLSAASAAGIENTSCGMCYVGIVSHGTARGTTEKNRAALIRQLTTPPFAALVKKHPDGLRWVDGSNTWPVGRYGYGPGKIRSPFVVRHGDRKKQWAVEAVLQWYASKGIIIERSRAFFFDDRADNALNFNGTGMNARQISCGSRDAGSASLVGYCGALPEEIVLEPGIHVCPGDTANRHPFNLPQTHPNGGPGGYAHHR